MAFDLKFCPEESCDGIVFKDIVGFFTQDNPYGYNSPLPATPTLDPDGTFSFTSYRLEIWRAVNGGVDVTAAPDVTIDLLETAHTVDPVTGYVSWTLDLETLGVESVRSGRWAFKATAVNGMTTYEVMRSVGFVCDITDDVDQMMLKRDFNNNCKTGCMPAEDFFAKLFLTKGQIRCSGPDIFQTNVDWLYYHAKPCC